MNDIMYLSKPIELYKSTLSTEVMYQYCSLLFNKYTTIYL